MPLTATGTVLARVAVLDGGGGVVDSSDLPLTSLRYPKAATKADYRERFGDTVTVDYTIASIDLERRRSNGDIKVTNQDGTLVAVATHILKWVANR